MLINKKIVLIKYYKDISFAISNINSIKTVYKVQNNTFLRFNAVDFQNGEAVDFENFEKDGTYIIFNKDNSSYELDTGVNDDIAEFVINKIQICIYKGSILEIISLNDIETIYKISENDQFLRWNRLEFEAGEPQDFENFENDKTYLIFSKNISYILWPPLNFNKGKIINSDNINWGLLDHVT